MTQIKDKNVLITGGASGIGKIMGRICLEKGAKNLIIWDVNPISLEQTRKELNTIGTVTTYSIDITDDQAVVKTYQQVLEQFGRIGVLINCAGIVRGEQNIQPQHDRGCAANHECEQHRTDGAVTASVAANARRQRGTYLQHCIGGGNDIESQNDGVRCQQMGSDRMERLATH